MKKLFIILALLITASAFGQDNNPVYTVSKVYLKWDSITKEIKTNRGVFVLKYVCGPSVYMPLVSSMVPAMVNGVEMLIENPNKDLHYPAFISVYKKVDGKLILIKDGIRGTYQPSGSCCDRPHSFIEQAYKEMK